MLADERLRGLVHRLDVERRAHPADAVAQDAPGRVARRRMQ